MLLAPGSTISACVGYSTPVCFSTPCASPPSYLIEGFLQLQKLVGAAIIEWKSGKRMGVSVSVRV